MAKLRPNLATRDRKTIENIHALKNEFDKDSNNEYSLSNVSVLMLGYDFLCLLGHNSKCLNAFVLLFGSILSGLLLRIVSGGARYTLVVQYTPPTLIRKSLIRNESLKSPRKTCEKHIKPVNTYLNIRKKTRVW